MGVQVRAALPSKSHLPPCDAGWANGAWAWCCKVMILRINNKINNAILLFFTNFAVENK